MDLHGLAARVGQVTQLDGIAGPVTKLVKRAAPPKSLAKDVLSGTWLGHPLHPLLTDIPIGSFTSATALDLIGGNPAPSGAAAVVAGGVPLSPPAAGAGAAGWSQTHGEG